MFLKRVAMVFVALVAVSGLFSQTASASNIAVAGFAFAGDAGTAKTRFPLSYAVYEHMRSMPGQSFSRLLVDRSAAVKNPAFELMAPEKMMNLKAADQALMTVLVLSGETILTENFGSYYKTFVNLRGEALIFDFKSKTVVRSYPINAALFDATPRPPSQERIAEFVAQLLMKEEGKGLFTQYLNRLSSATLPAPGTRTIQVRKAEMAPEALALMPEALRSQPKIIESMLADSFGSVLSAKAGVPVLPSGAGHAMGTMAMRLENGDDVQLKIGEGDYLFDIKINKFAKVKTAETRVGTSYVYGAYANIHFFEPTLNTDYINTDLKNGESAVVPAGLVSTDDFAAYQDAIRGMFLKLADAFEGADPKWVTTAASAKDITKQIEATRTILKASK
ncbi:hypothetical protein [Massilia sp. YIM B04103]|uniref:hypothetical protein n=1 Tax=Massilia sp. YIM B04103 TaxID=2963106 RepID=UPI002108B016|nr:hypothetical protein [Massilia sp. YIM B04103]